jgi:hypothetical protein
MSKGTPSFVSSQPAGGTGGCPCNKIWTLSVPQVESCLPEITPTSAALCEYQIALYSQPPKDQSRPGD